MAEKPADMHSEAFHRLAAEKGYRRSGNSFHTVYVKGMPDERRHLIELTPTRLLYGILYRQGFASDWEDAVRSDFRLHAPSDCHYRRAIPFDGSMELEAATITAEEDMNGRLSVSKEQDKDEWKQKDKAFRKWFHALLLDYGFRKEKSKSTSPLSGGLMWMEAQEQKSLYSDVFYFNFTVYGPAADGSGRMYIQSMLRWHDKNEYTLDWILMPRDRFESSLRTYLQNVICPILSGEKTLLDIQSEQDRIPTPEEPDRTQDI